MILFITLYSILALQEPHVKQFLVEASKSGPIKYNFVKPVDCESGKLKNTYALAQNGKVVLKQISKDGSIGPVCVKWLSCRRAFNHFFDPKPKRI